MNHKLLSLVFFATISLMIVSSARATVHLPSNAYLGFCSDSYVSFDLAQEFDSVSRINNLWYFDNIGIKTISSNISITGLNNTWINYTLSANGYQIFEVDKPYNVYFNGMKVLEGSYWNYSEPYLFIDNNSESVQIHFYVPLTISEQIQDFFEGTLFSTEGYISLISLFVVFALISLLSLKTPIGGLFGIVIFLALASQYILVMSSEGEFSFHILFCLFGVIVSILMIAHKLKKI